MERKLDLRGMNCPEPVVKTREELLRGGTDPVVVLVDTEESATNVTRMAASLGWSAASSQAEGHMELLLSRTGDVQPPSGNVDACATVDSAAAGVVFFVAGDTLGSGDEKLGRVLMRSFAKTLKDLPTKPSKIIFMNKGVVLCCAGSEVVEDIRGIEGMGTEVLCCGTCLDFYNLKEALQAGRVSNMFEILDALATAAKVIRI